MSEKNPGLHEDPADRELTVGSVWRRTYSGRRYRVYLLSKFVPHGDPVVSYQSLDDGEPYTQFVARFLGGCDKAPGVPRFVKEGA